MFVWPRVVWHVVLMTVCLALCCVACSVDHCLFGLVLYAIWLILVLAHRPKPTLTYVQNKTDQGWKRHQRHTRLAYSTNTYTTLQGDRRWRTSFTARVHRAIKGQVCVPYILYARHKELACEDGCVCVQRE